MIFPKSNDMNKEKFWLMNHAAVVMAGFLKNYKKCSLYVQDLMASPSSWEFYKEEQTKILWVNICTQDLTDVAISINKWWKTRYPEFKMRIVSKKEFENIKMQEQQQQQ